MSRGMSRGGGGFPIIIAVLGVLILAVIGIFIWMTISNNNNNNNDALNNNGLTTMNPTAEAVTQVPVETPTAVPTQAPTEAPTQAPTEAPTQAPTQYVTAPPVYNTNTVWINIPAERIRSQANFDSEVVGKIPYGQQVTGDVSGKWMSVAYEGVQGYIYLGKTSFGTDSNGDTIWRKCVVYSESSLEALPDEPDADEVDLITSIGNGSISGGLMTVEIKFSEKVYSDDNGTGDINKSCFEVTNGSIEEMSGESAGTTFVSLRINPYEDGTDVTVEVKSQRVFNSEGKAAESESASFANP